MLIRSERAGDYAAISAVTAAAFADVAHSDQSEPAIVERLRAAGALTLSLVAIDGDALLGHAAFSPVTIDDMDAMWFGLGPVSVDPARQGRGIGSALIRHGLARLRTDGAAGCVVLGDPGYYARFGFGSDPALTYPDAPAVYFTRLRFPGGSPRAGRVAYHPAFTR